MTERLPSLGAKLARQFLLLAVLPVLAVFAVSWLMVVPLLVQQAETRNQELALAVRDQVTLHLESRQRAAALLVSHATHGKDAVGAFKADIDALLRGDRFVQAAYVADESGTVLAAALAPDGGRFDTDVIGLDLSGQPYFSAARRQLQPVWSDTFLSTLTGQITAVLAVPGAAHTAVVELSLAALSQSLVEVAESGTTQVAVLDRAGRIIAHANPRLALQQENLRGLAIVEAALGGRGGEARVRVTGVAHLAQALPVAPVGWVVFVAQPEATVMAPVLRLSGVVGGVLASTMLLAVLVGWRLARRTGNEVALLAEGAQRMAANAESLPAPRFTNAEFAAVWTRLRELFEQLHLRDRQTRVAQQDLQAVLDAATEVAVIATDTQGLVTVFNIGAQRVLGYAASEVVGLCTPMTWHEPAEVQARAEVLRRKYGHAIGDVETLIIEARHGGYEVRDWTFRRRNGETLDVSLAVTAMRTPEGDLKGFLGVAIDITERRRAAANELARRAADLANRAKSDFLSRMSHELRTPLNAVLGYAQLLDQDPATPPTTGQRERLQHIQRAGWHLVLLIDDVLDLARIESGHLRVNIISVDLRTVLEQARRLAAPQLQQHAVVLDMDAISDDTGTAFSVAADPTRLAQVFVNLLGNAAKYNRPQGRIAVRCQRDGDTVRIGISDTGRGMTAAQLAQLYVPFDRLGMENSGIDGTGIGLVITRHLVGLMHGKLEVSSEPDVGSTFTLTLPLVAVQPAAAEPVARPDAGAASRGRQGSVLYIEDNEVNAKLMRALLRQRSEVTLNVARTAQAGIAAARAAPPDILMLDLHLPEDAGDAVLDALAADERLRDVPVVVISADATRTQRARMASRGVAAYLTKPIDVAETLRVLDGLLDKRAAAVAAPGRAGPEAAP